VTIDNVLDFRHISLGIEAGCNPMVLLMYANKNSKKNEWTNNIQKSNDNQQAMKL
jgi:hypothetical protein